MEFDVSVPDNPEELADRIEALGKDYQGLLDRYELAHRPQDGVDRESSAIAGEKMRQAGQFLLVRAMSSKQPGATVLALIRDTCIHNALVRFPITL